jgi:hypothetical protein
MLPIFDALCTVQDGCDELQDVEHAPHGNAHAKGPWHVMYHARHAHNLNLPRVKTRRKCHTCDTNTLGKLV